jgi:hypothetical protein
MVEPRRSRWWCFALLFLVLFAHVQATILISEIMYNPRLRPDLFEYVELYNDAVDNADISGYVLTGPLLAILPSCLIFAPLRLSFNLS